jgi:hypothetical protein
MAAEQTTVKKIDMLGVRPPGRELICWEFARIGNCTPFHCGKSVKTLSTLSTDVVPEWHQGLKPSACSSLAPTSYCRASSSKDPRAIKTKRPRE